MTTTRVVLIEDSAFMRILISDMLRKENGIDLVASAGNGKDGVDLARSLRTDVVVTDMVMPEYDGLYVVKELRKSPPIPVILLSALQRTDQQVFEALEEGAFEFIDKPEVGSSKIDYRLAELIRNAHSSKAGFTKHRERNSYPHTFPEQLPYDIVVIGSSTGGPGAIEHVLENIPKNFAIPVVVAQHMPERFIDTFASRLHSKGLLRVKVAEAGETPEPGTVYLAPGNGNIMMVRRRTGRVEFAYNKTTFPEFNSPSIDCLFTSAANVYGSRCIGAILTGMGKDGTEGMRAIKSKGGFTIAQDESTSVVFGMPRSAAEAGVVQKVLKLSQIPPFIVGCLS